MLPLARTGVPEESYFTFTYSPIRDETGGVGGVFCAVVETTDKVIEERRLRLLNALAEGRRAHRRRPRLARMPQRRLRARRATSLSRCYICSTTLASPRSRARPTAQRAVALAPITIRRGDARTVGAYAEVQGRSARRPTRSTHRAARAVRSFCRSSTRAAASALASSSPASARCFRRARPTRASTTLLAASISQGVSERRRLRGGTQARRGARGARSRQDRVLQQRQPRIPDAAHPDAGARGRRAREGRRSRPTTASGGRSCTATRSASRSSSTRCSISRASRPGGSRRRTSQPT